LTKLSVALASSEFDTTAISPPRLPTNKLQNLSRVKTNISK
jgi:hypothetical protein